MNGPPTLFASRALIGRNLKTCQTEISRIVAACKIQFRSDFFGSIDKVDLQADRSKVTNINRSFKGLPGPTKTSSFQKDLGKIRSPNHGMYRQK